MEFVIKGIAQIVEVKIVLDGINIFEVKSDFDTTISHYRKFIHDNSHRILSWQEDNRLEIEFSVHSQQSRI